jgi:hypothetical protein
MLRGAAGVGAVSVAAAAGAGSIFAATRSANAATDKHAGTVGGAATHPAGDEPLVAYLRDASTGEFEVFHGTRQVRVRDPRLAAQLLDGLATAQ